MGNITDKLQAVLNSKNAIKSTLINKGLEPTNVFSTYAEMIGGSLKSASEIIDNFMCVEVISSLQSISSLPSIFTGHNDKKLVVFNNEIHLIGQSSDGCKHYKWNGSSWVSVSTLPFTISGGLFNVVVFKGELHLFGGNYTNGYNSNKHYKWNGTSWTSVSTLPFHLGDGSSAVVLNNEIHILGGYYGLYKHYKWNGTSWTSVSTSAYVYLSGAVVFNDEIHIFGGGNDNYKKQHIKWNGSSWVSVSTLPFSYASYGLAAININNNEIHIFGENSSSIFHYKWNGSDWMFESTFGSNFIDAVYMDSKLYMLQSLQTLDSTGVIQSTTETLFYLDIKSNYLINSKYNKIGNLPCDVTDHEVLLFNNEIHILANTQHYKWNGTSWVSVSTLPFDFEYGNAVVLNNEIHIMGGYNGEVVYKHYKWNGTSWTSVSTLPFDFIKGSAVTFNNEIHIFGSEFSSGRYKHYKWNGTSWTSVSTTTYDTWCASAVVFNDEIHILGGSLYNSSLEMHKHYKWNGTSWVSVSTLPSAFGDGNAVVLNNEIHIMGGRRNIHHYKWNGSEWVLVDIPPFDCGYCFMVEIDGKINVLSGTEQYELSDSILLD